VSRIDNLFALGIVLMGAVLMLVFVWVVAH
jgi:hypothetical protein